MDTGGGGRAFSRAGHADAHQCLRSLNYHKYGHFRAHVLLSPPPFVYGRGGLCDMSYPAALYRRG